MKILEALTLLLITRGAIVKGLKGVRGVRGVSRGLKGGKGEPPDVEVGNNLAVPVLLAENEFLDGTTISSGLPELSLALSSFYYEPVADPSTQCLTTIVLPGYPCYYDNTVGIAWLQRDVNKWGCWLIPWDFYYGSSAPFVVSAADVGDRLESPTSYPLSGTVIRVEVTLFQNSLPSPSASFDFGDGSAVPQALPMDGPFLGTTGITEIHGTTAFDDVNPLSTVTALNDLIWEDSTTPLDGMQAIVYSTCARYYIQLIGAATPVSFDHSTGSWDGGTPDVYPVGGDYMDGEITVSGKLTYGYNWRVRGLASGVYRITFMIDPDCATPTNARIDSGTVIASPGGFLTSHIIQDAQYTSSPRPATGGGLYIDVEIDPRSGGKGGGKGGP